MQKIKLNKKRNLFRENCEKIKDKEKKTYDLPLTLPITRVPTVNFFFVLFLFYKIQLNYGTKHMSRN